LENDNELINNMINEDEIMGDDDIFVDRNGEEGDHDDGVLDVDDAQAVNDVRDLLVDTEDESVNENPPPFSMKIKLPDKDTYIYKTTLVSLLNSSPDGKLSKDRLTRVQSSNPTQSSFPLSAVDGINYRRSIGLYSDVAILRKDSEGNHHFILSRVQRMIKK